MKTGKSKSESDCLKAVAVATMCKFVTDFIKAMQKSDVDSIFELIEYNESEECFFDKGLWRRIKDLLVSNPTPEKITSSHMSACVESVLEMYC